MDIRSRSQGKASLRRAKVGCVAAFALAVLSAVPVQSWGAELSLGPVTASVPTPPPPPIPQTTTPPLPIPAAPSPAPLPNTTTTPLPAPLPTTPVKLTEQTQSTPSSPAAPSAQLGGSSPATSEGGSEGPGSTLGRPSGARSQNRAAAPAAYPSRALRRAGQFVPSRIPSQSAGAVRPANGWLSLAPALSGLRLADAAEAPSDPHAPSQHSSGQWVPWPSGANLRGILAAAGSWLPAILVLVAAALIVCLLFADELGWGPRHAAWRARYLRRPPR
jgi:hypothetical protein